MKAALRRHRSSRRIAATMRDRFPDRLLAIFLAALVVALVLGYLFLNKLVDISSEEDCALAHRKNCAASEVPSDR